MFLYWSKGSKRGLQDFSHLAMLEKESFSCRRTAMMVTRGSVGVWIPLLLTTILKCVHRVHSIQNGM